MSTRSAFLHLLMWALAVIPASGVRAQGQLSMYLEPSLGVSDLVDDVGTITVYVVLLTPGSTGIRYRIENCNSTLTWLGDVNHESAVGDSQTGVALAYACVPGPILLQTITYWGSGDSPINGVLLARPYPHNTTGFIEGSDCGQVPTAILGGCVCIKCEPQYSCHLDVPPWYAPPPPCGPVPVDESSWGRIKALYR